MNARALLVLAVLLAAGCRSDGGWGRADRGHGMQFAAECMGDRTNYDVRRTWYLLRSAPGALSRSVETTPAEFANTYSLYFEGHARR